MSLQEIERKAKSLMTIHGVGHVKFEFDGGKSRLGACHHMRVGGVVIPTKITLSRHYASILPMQEIEEVILHEIAHALTPGHGHNHVWRAAARRIGAKGDRCATPSASPDKAVSGVCTNPDCQKVVSQLHRLPQRVSYHSTCGRDFPLRWFKNGRMMKVSDMPSRYQSEYMRNYAK